MLFHDADEVVDVAQPVVFHVEGVAAKARAMANSTPSAPGAGMSTRAPITKERPRMLTACHSGTGATSGRYT